MSNTDEFFGVHQPDATVPPDVDTRCPSCGGTLSQASTDGGRCSACGSMVCGGTDQQLAEEWIRDAPRRAEFGPPPSGPDPIDEMNEALAQARRKIDDIQGREMRLLAAVGESEKARADLSDRFRGLEAKVNITKDGHLAIIKVLDDVGRMIGAAIDRQDAGPFRDGILLIHSNFLAALRDLGIEKVECKLGDQFDPNIHNAINVGPGPAGTVIEIFAHGFRFVHGPFAGQLVRPTYVVVGNGESNGQVSEQAA
jgi:molecular chaperone GrpE (heat shock protein)